MLHQITSSYWRRNAHRLLSAAIALTLAPGLFASDPAMPSSLDHLDRPAHPAQLAREYGRAPLSFEANHGQAAKEVKFLARGNGYGLFLTAQQAVLALHKPAAASTQNGSRRLGQFGVTRDSVRSAHATPNHSGEFTQGRGESGTTDVIQMQLAGANPEAQAVGEDRLPGTSNYFLGNDPAKWRSNIPTYSRVRYKSVYQGVDLVYYGNQQRLEYDFIVAPHADAQSIRLRFAGATAIELTESGDLAIQAADGAIAFRKPTVYQMRHGMRQPVTGAYNMLADQTVGFKLGPYDRSQPLVIDPVLAYSTFLGGTNAEFVVSAAIDAAGDAYVTGLTISTDFPLTPGAFQAVNYATGASAVSTAFISKFNSTGTALLYSTFLGGDAIPGTLHSQGDYGHAIAVDSSGDAYIAGYTYSNNFPITSGAFQKSNIPSTYGLATGFVSKLNPTGSALIYSTYLGGSSLTEPGSIAIDSGGDAFVSGQTYSDDFPVTSGAFQTTNKSAAINGANAFVTKLNPAGSALVYSTYLGGSADTGYIFSDLILTTPIAVDKAGDAFVASFTESANFPVTKGAYNTVDQSGGYIVTVSKLNPAGSALIYSTFLGGVTNSSFPQGLAIDSAGNAYIAGFTACTDFPVTTGAFQTTNKADTNTSTSPNANQNGFVTKLNAAGSALVYSTYLGGTTGPWGGDVIYGIDVDSTGHAYVTGSAMSADFPVTSNAYQPKNHGASHCCDYTTYTDNAFLTEFNATGTGLIYSTYLGGSGYQNPNGPGGFGDEAYAIALNPSGQAVIAGYASSPNFPVTPDAFETKYDSQQNTGFVAMFDLGTAPSTKTSETALAPSANNVVPGTAVTFNVSVTAASGTAVPTGNVVFSIDEKTVATVALSAAGKASYSSSTLAAGAHYILASYSGSGAFTASGDGFTEYVVPIKPVITPAAGTYTSQQTVTITSPTKTGVLYYTLNGVTPSIFTTPYTAPLIVNTNKTVEAVSIAQSDATSTLASNTYVIIGSPWVLAEPATAIATPAATLNALVSTLGLAGSYQFVYGTSKTALTASTAATALSASSAKVAASAKLTGLKTKTTYFYQVVVTTAGGVCSGAILSFTSN